MDKQPEASCDAHSVLKVASCDVVQSVRLVDKWAKKLHKTPSATVEGFGRGGYVIFDAHDARSMNPAVYSLCLRFERPVHATALRVSGVGFGGSVVVVALDRDFRSVVGRTHDAITMDNTAAGGGPALVTTRHVPLMLPGGSCCRVERLYVREEDKKTMARHRYDLFVMGHEVSVCAEGASGRAPPHLARFVDRGDLFNNDWLSDFAIDFPNGRTLRLHKFVLAMSPYFAAMLGKGGHNSVGRGDGLRSIRMEEVVGDSEDSEDQEASQAYAAVVFVTYYMYTARVQRDLSSSETLLGFVLEAARLCDMWDLPELKGFCERELEKRLRADTLIRLYYHAERDRMQSLEKSCEFYWHNNAKALRWQPSIARDDIRYTRLGGGRSPLLRLNNLLVPRPLPQSSSSSSSSSHGGNKRQRM